MEKNAGADIVITRQMHTVTIIITTIITTMIIMSMMAVRAAMTTSTAVLMPSRSYYI